MTLSSGPPRTLRRARTACSCQAWSTPSGIAELAKGPLPVAVMVWPGAPSVAELAAAGAVRISLGSAIAQAAYAVAARAATELLTSGTYDSVAGGIAYDTMNDAVKPVVR